MNNNQGIQNLSNFFRHQFETKNQEEHDQEFSERLSTGKQNPQIASVSCADSFCLGLYEACGISPQPNHVFTADAAGNPLVREYYIKSKNEVAVAGRGTLSYWMNHIAKNGSADKYFLIVEGHTMCGAMNAIMGDVNGEVVGLREELEFLKSEVYEPLKERLENIKDPQERLAYLAQHNVDYQISKAMDFYKDVVKSGKITFIGTMRDLTGTLYTKEYKKKGDVYVTNIDGVTEIDRMKKSKVLSLLNLPQDTIDFTVRRI